MMGCDGTSPRNSFSGVAVDVGRNHFESRVALPRRRPAARSAALGPKPSSRETSPIRDKSQPLSCDDAGGKDPRRLTILRKRPTLARFQLPGLVPRVLL